MRNIEEKLDFIEKEITELKLIIIQKTIPKTKVSLKGLLSGSNIKDKEIEASKKSLFKAGA